MPIITDQVRIITESVCLPACSLILVQNRWYQEYCGTVISAKRVISSKYRSIVVHIASAGECKIDERALDDVGTLRKQRPAPRSGGQALRSSDKQWAINSVAKQRSHAQSSDQRQPSFVRSDQPTSALNKDSNVASSDRCAPTTNSYQRQTGHLQHFEASVLWSRAKT